LDWLNERTDDEVNFFGVELEVVKIGDSPPAPVFRVVAQPNDWQKALKRPQGLTNLSQSRHDFFERVMEIILAKRPRSHRPKVGYENWLSMASGPFGSYGITFAAGGKLRVDIYLDMTSPRDGAKILFDALRWSLAPLSDASDLCYPMNASTASLSSLRNQSSDTLPSRK
jgi:hypothetical protein